MKKIVILLVMLGIIIAGSIYYFKNNIGDVRPVVLPTHQNNKSKAGNPVNIPLTIPDGFQISIFADNLGRARDLEFSPGGTLLVSDMDDGKVLALPDKDNNGTADTIITVLSGLRRPHGIRFYNGKLFVAQETQLIRYNWNEQELSASVDKKILDLPTGGRHFSRSLVFNSQGKLFISIGSTCDVCYETNQWIGTVIVSDADGNDPKVYAKGLRNAVFITMRPGTDELWATEMGRDFLGDTTPSDEVNLIEEGKDYGWPICYENKIHDTSFDKNQYIRDPCIDTAVPKYLIPAHSAPLGLTFVQSDQFPQKWQGDLLVAYHGSWNRSTPIGYKVVRLDIEGDTVIKEEDFITGFLQNSTAEGRPVDMTFDENGNLFISDDKAGVIYLFNKK